MSKKREAVSWVNPSDYRAGAEWIKSTQHPKEPRDGDPLHAHWSPIGAKFRPFVEKYGLSTDMRVNAWCGARLRLILDEPFDPRGGPSVSGLRDLDAEGLPVTRGACALVDGAEARIDVDTPPWPSDGPLRCGGELPSRVWPTGVNAD